MDRDRWLAAAAFGTLNMGLVVVASPSPAVLLLQAWWIGLILWALSIFAAKWSLGVSDDLWRLTARDAAGMIVRGAIAGIGVGAVIVSVAMIPDWGLVGPAAALGGFFGMFAGLGCAVADAIVLGAVRMFVPPRA